MTGIIILIIIVGLVLILLWQYKDLGQYILWNGNELSSDHKYKNNDGIHIGIIPDGNRRWVKENGKTKEELFEKWKSMQMFFNFDTLKDKLLKYNINPELIKYIEKINEVSMYVISIDNLKREDFSLNMVYKFIEYISNLDNIDVNVNIIGRIDLLPNLVKANIQKILNKSKNKSKYTINLAVSYDPIEDIKTFETRCRPKQSQMDLVFRSGREKRSSGFFPCHTLYSEWYFSDKLWPDINESDLVESIEYYSKRQRRFGK